MRLSVLALTAIAMGGALLLGAATPVAAQAIPPSPEWVDGARKVLYVHSANPQDCGKMGPSSWNQDTVSSSYYMHVDPNDRCAVETEGKQTNVLNGASIRVAMGPNHPSPIPLIKDGEFNLTIWVGHRTQATGTEDYAVINVKVTLRQGENNTTSDWSGAADPTAIIGGTQWYKHEFQLKLPQEWIYTDPDEPLHINVDQNSCSLAAAGVPECVDDPQLHSMGNQWFLGTLGEHASTIELPIPSAYVSGKLWPPIECDEGYEVNETSKQCQIVVLDCPPDEFFDEASLACEPLPESDLPGSVDGEGGDRNVTTTTNATAEVQGNETGKKGLPGFETFATLAAVSLAFLVAARRRRDE